MRHFALQLIAASSLLLSYAAAETRPRYGGTMHATVLAAPTSLDPAELEKTDANLARLVYDTLVTLDDRGFPRPALATSWQSDPGNQRWQFILRAGVTFADGAALAAESVAAALRTQNPLWHVSAEAETVIVQLDSPDIDLPAELALVHNSIVRRDAAKLLGTGPFTVARWLPEKKLTLAAREDYFGGRPFLDSVEINLNGARATDWSHYELAETTTRSPGNGRLRESSEPSDLLALVFARAPVTSEEERLRDALSLSIDRKIIKDVLFHGSGEPAGGLLPEWMSGYDFLFSSESNVLLARQTVSQTKPVPAWSLGYDPSDPAARLMAERIALNAADVGIKLIPAIAAKPDIQLTRVKILSLDPHVALDNLAATIDVTAPKFAGTSSEELYAAERALLQSRRVIPLLHLNSALYLSDRSGAGR